jgi:hypothetical protein
MLRHAKPRRPFKESGGTAWPLESLPYIGGDSDEERTERERERPAGRLTWAAATVSGEEWLAIFYGDEHLADRMVCYRVVMVGGRRKMRQANPNEVSRPVVEALLRQGNDRIGIDTLNHSRPELFCLWSDWQCSIRPRFLKPESPAEEAVNARAAANWSKASAMVPGATGSNSVKYINKVPTLVANRRIGVLPIK